MTIYELIIEPEREEHIARHHVTGDEAEEIALGTKVALRTRNRRYALIGQTAGGRYLKVIVAPRGGGLYGLVTAMAASDSERRLYQRHHGN